MNYRNSAVKFGNFDTWFISIEYPESHTTNKNYTNHTGIFANT